jgi:hypothetical protein
MEGGVPMIVVFLPYSALFTLGVCPIPPYKSEAVSTLWAIGRGMMGTVKP